MNIGELAKGVAGTTGTSEAEAKAAIAAVFDQIASAAAKGEDVSITGFGKFSVAHRGARTGRNPQTGATVQIAASKAPKFTAGAGLKGAVKAS